MKRSIKIKKKINDYLFDHILLRNGLDQLKTFFYCAISAVIFAFGFTSFITPMNQANDISIVTGGVSGLSQNIYLIISFFNSDITLSEVTSIAYFVINVPILIFAFFAVGKKFAIYTLINVLLSSIFIRLFPLWFAPSLQSIFATPQSWVDEGIMNIGGVLGRVIFGAICTGLSSALAFRGNISCGGIDVFSFYFSVRKSTSVGKYAIALNGVVIGLYVILSICKNPNAWNKDLIMLLLSFSYLFICSLLIDTINHRNKKVQIQIITSVEHMSDVLLAHFPHSVTLMKGKGAYSGADRYVLYMVVSSSETNRVTAVARRVDEHAFISVMSLVQVYGNFFIKPVE